MASKPTTARHDLTVWRNDDVFEYPLRVIGPDLTSVDLRMQARLQGDTPGLPALDLSKVTNGNAEGIRVAGVTTVDGVKHNDVRIRINKSTMQNPAKFPYAGGIGDTSWLEYAFLIGGRTRLTGKIFVPPHPYGSDNAPTNRQIYLGRSRAKRGRDADDRTRRGRRARDRRRGPGRLHRATGRGRRSSC
jgi:hypothetical protein